jgi:predicted transcriptional regulator
MKSMNTQKPLKSKVSITLDEEVIKRIKELAEADDRNFSQYINLVLKRHIESQNRSDRL